MSKSEEEKKINSKDSIALRRDTPFSKSILDPSVQSGKKELDKNQSKDKNKIIYALFNFSRLYNSISLKFDECHVLDPNGNTSTPRHTHTLKTKESGIKETIVEIKKISKNPTSEIINNKVNEEQKEENIDFEKSIIKNIRRDTLTIDGMTIIDQDYLFGDKTNKYQPTAEDVYNAINKDTNTKETLQIVDQVIFHEQGLLNLGWSILQDIFFENYRDSFSITNYSIEDRANIEITNNKQRKKIFINSATTCCLKSIEDMSKNKKPDNKTTIETQICIDYKNQPYKIDEKLSNFSAKKGDIPKLVWEVREENKKNIALIKNDQIGLKLNQKSNLSEKDRKNFRSHQWKYYSLFLIDLVGSGTMLAFTSYSINHKTPPYKWLMILFLALAMFALLLMSSYCSWQNFNIPNRLKGSIYEVSKIKLYFCALVNSISISAIIFFSLILISGAENFKFPLFEKQSLYSHSLALLVLAIACFVLFVSSLLSTHFLIYRKFKTLNSLQGNNTTEHFKKTTMQLTALNYERSFAWLFFTIGFTIAYLGNTNRILSIHSQFYYPCLMVAFTVGFIFMRIAAMGEFSSRWQSNWSIAYRYSSLFYKLFRENPSFLGIKEKQVENKENQTYYHNKVYV